MIERHQPAPPSAIGATGRYPEGLDLPPVINPQQAAWDKRKFEAMAQGGWIDRAKELRAQGWADSRIGKEMGKSPKTIRKFLGNNPKSKSAHPPAEVTAKRKTVAAELKALGFSQRQIAEKIGVTQQTVNYWFKPKGKAA